MPSFTPVIVRRTRSTCAAAARSPRRARATAARPTPNCCNAPCSAVTAPPVVFAAVSQSRAGGTAASGPGATGTGKPTGAVAIGGGPGGGGVAAAAAGDAADPNVAASAPTRATANAVATTVAR